MHRKKDKDEKQEKNMRWARERIRCMLNVLSRTFMAGLRFGVSKLDKSLKEN